jgi:tricorn protease
MKKIILLFLIASAGASVLGAQTPGPLLLQSPTLSKTHIVFVYGGSLWSVPREGGDARRLVVGDPGTASGPLFSPDGTQVAFTGNFDTNEDVYVVPAAGGEPRRLTMHPGTDVALAWTPDGKRLLFRSSREAYSRFEKLFTVSVDGGFPMEVPLPMGVQGAFSADAAQLAYVPTWNRRGGAGDVNADMCAAFLVALFLVNAPRRTIVDVQLPSNYAELVAQARRTQSFTLVIISQ